MSKRKWSLMNHTNKFSTEVTFDFSEKVKTLLEVSLLAKVNKEVIFIYLKYKFIFGYSL